MRWEFTCNFNTGFCDYVKGCNLFLFSHVSHRAVWGWDYDCTWQLDRWKTDDLLSAAFSTHHEIEKENPTRWKQLDKVCIYGNSPITRLVNVICNPSNMIISAHKSPYIEKWYTVYIVIYIEKWYLLINSYQNKNLTHLNLPTHHLQKLVYH